MAVRPYVLSFSPFHCAYCTRSSHNQELLRSDFGIRCCERHQVDACQDLRYYLHRQGKVRVSDVINLHGNPPVGVVEILNAIMQRPFIIEDMKDGTEAWDLDTTANFIHTSGVWTLPVIRRLDEARRLMPIQYLYHSRRIDNDQLAELTHYLFRVYQAEFDARGS